MATTLLRRLVDDIATSPLSAVAEALRATVVHATPGTAREGVPITVKANVCVKNFTGNAASHALSGYVPPYSASAVERLAAAGGDIVGTTNMDEFGMGSATQYSVHGPCLNPWSPALSLETALRARAGSEAPAGPLQDMRARRGWLVPGGSSGGAAVSVALGTCTIAVGSDTGGSVRQPAGFTGVVGFKPSYGRIPRHGLIAYASSLDTIGLMGRSVWDVAAAYGVCAGRDERDDTSIACGHAPWSVEEVQGVLGGRVQLGGTGQGKRVVKELAQGKPLAGLRVGIPHEYAPGTADAGNVACSDAWEHAAQLLSSAGAQVVRVSLPSTRLALPAYYVLAPAEAASNLSRYDGVRYGHRASDDPLTPSDSAQGQAQAQALHALYTRTRSEGFGAEVQRRIMLGNFVLSQAARAEYYDCARAAMQHVRADFGSVFRPGPGGGEGGAVPEADGHQDALGGAVPEADGHQDALGGKHTMRGMSVMQGLNPAAHPSAPHETGVDILLTPVTPGPPWPSPSPSPSSPSHPPPTQGDPLREYLQDVMTIPASLAHLPAVAVPVGVTQCDSALASAAAEDAAHAWGIHPSDPVSPALHSLARGTPLPMGVQLVGRYADEVTVLKVAAVLEARAGFEELVTGRRPWEARLN